MRNVLTIAAKEFRTFFQTPVGYVILFLFTLLGGWFFFYEGRFFLTREASLRGLFGPLPLLFMVLAPAITMRLWAEERRSGTLEVLLTMPVRDAEAVLGKFLAATGLVAVWLACLLPMAAVVAFVGEPDLGPVWGGFLGALLLGAAYVSVGLAASAFTENQIIALVVGSVLCFAFFLAGYDPLVLAFPAALRGFLYQVSLSTHFQSIARGVLDSRDLVYYASFIAFFLLLNHWAVRRQRGGGTTVALAGGVLLVGNYLVLDSSWFLRADLTEDRRYTLAEGSVGILEGLDDDLVLTAFLPSDLPAGYTNLRRDVEDLVREFEAHSDGYLRVEILDPSGSEEVQRLAQEEGIPQSGVGSVEAHRMEQQFAYLGVVLEYRDRKVVYPDQRRRENFSIAGLEYELAMRIAKISRAEELMVGFQVAERRPPGSPPPKGRAADRYRPDTNLTWLDQRVRDRFDTDTLDLNEEVDPEVRTLVVANPKRFSAVQKFWLDQFLMRGGRLLCLLDGTEESSLMARQTGSLVRSPLETAAEDLWSHYGFALAKQTVLDRSCLPVMMDKPTYFPAIPVVLESSINQDHPVTARVRELVLPFCAPLSLTPKPEVAAVELVKTSPAAAVQDGPLQFLDPSSVGDPSGWDRRYLVAGLLQGRFRSFFTAREIPEEIAAAWGDPGAGGEGGFLQESPADAKILVIGTGEIGVDRYTRQFEGNLQLLLNAVDYLTTDQDLSGIRARRQLERPFAEPPERTRAVCLGAGMYGVPVLLAVLGLLVHLWRRVWRPGRTRRRMAAGRRDEG